tara:strand:+ start:393 stop:707 length:315 start_codon:yes stop_codon:yes gene_type:complete
MNSVQLEFFDVPSPCIGICQSDDKGHCIGCFRSREERQCWTTLNANDKQKVIKRCQQRKKRKNPNVKEKVVKQEKVSVQASLLDPPQKNILSKSENIDFGDFEL